MKKFEIATQGKEHLILKWYLFKIIIFIIYNKVYKTEKF